MLSFILRRFTTHTSNTSCITFYLSNSFINNYSKFGIFNVSVIAKNRVTEVEQFDDIMTIVTEAPCAPPKLSIPFNSTDPLSPAEYFRAETVVISTNAVLNCTPVISTK